MEALAAAFEACLADVEAEQPAEEDGDTGVMPPNGPSSGSVRTEAVSAPPSTRVAKPAKPRRSGLRVAALLLLAAIVVVGNLLVLELVFDGDLPWPAAASRAACRSNAVADFDPEGDVSEHPESVAAATDGDPATSWTTEEYENFDKDGVGIMLDAGSRRGALAA